MLIYSKLEKDFPAKEPRLKFVRIIVFTFFYIFFSEIIIRVSSVFPDKEYEEHIYNFMAYKATEMNIIIDGYT